jgi:predicted PurR-regulated permease PerM
MTFWERLVFFLLTIGVAWYFNSEKNRYLDKQADAYKNKDERAIGQFGEKITFYSNAMGLMFFVILIMFIFLLSGEF